MNHKLAPSLRLFNYNIYFSFAIKEQKREREKREKTVITVTLCDSYESLLFLSMINLKSYYFINFYQ